MIAMGLGYRAWDSEEMLRLVNSLIQYEEENPEPQKQGFIVSEIN